MPKISEQEMQQRLNDFYRAGLGLLETKGSFEQISIRAIAEAAGVSTGAFFHYFPGKDDYLRFLMKESVTMDIGYLREQIQAAVDMAGLVDAVEAHMFAHWHDYMVTGRLMIEMMPHFEQGGEEDLSLMTELEEIGAVLIGDMAQRIAEFADQGLVRADVDAQATSMSIFVLYDHAVLRDYFSSPVPKDQLAHMDVSEHPTFVQIRNMINQLLKGVLL